MLTLEEFNIRHPDYDFTESDINTAVQDANNIVREYHGDTLSTAVQIAADIALYRLVVKSETYAAEQFQHIYDNAMKQLTKSYTQYQDTQKNADGTTGGLQTVEIESDDKVFGRTKGLL